MTIGTLFSGGGGFDIGAHQAGLMSLWGVEYDDAIASVARANGLPVLTGDVTEMAWAALPRVDWLHASPPCPNYSVAKAGAVETAADRALSRSVIEAVRTLRPDWFSIENVRGYEGSAALLTILDALTRLGYRHTRAVLCAADYGVPQTRHRLIVVASRVAEPRLPVPTHTERPTPGLFWTMERWVGWYEATADLLPGLPESKLAPWQMKRLPAELTTLLVGAPAFTVTANQNQASQIRAVLVSGLLGAYSTSMTIRDGGIPSPTVTTSHNQRDLKAVTVAPEVRVVRLTPRCLARFQSFPDTYTLPEKPELACRIIGNAVPCGLARAVVAANLPPLPPRPVRPDAAPAAAGTRKIHQKTKQVQA